MVLNLATIENAGLTLKVMELCHNSMASIGNVFLVISDIMLEL